MAKPAAQGLVLHAAEVELSVRDGTEQSIIVLVEEVEAGVRTALVFNRLGELVQLVASIAGIFEAERNSR